MERLDVRTEKERRDMGQSEMVAQAMQQCEALRREGWSLKSVWITDSIPRPQNSSAPGNPAIVLRMDRVSDDKMRRLTARLCDQYTVLFEFSDSGERESIYREVDMKRLNRLMESTKVSLVWEDPAERKIKKLRT